MENIIANIDKRWGKPDIAKYIQIAADNVKTHNQFMTLLEMYPRLTTSQTALRIFWNKWMQNKPFSNNDRYQWRKIKNSIKEQEMTPVTEFSFVPRESYNESESNIYSEY
jgi:hypothetical protein